MISKKAHLLAAPDLLASGIVLYLLYVIWIGGDFMSGRFLSAALFGSVALLSMVFVADLKTATPILLLILIVNFFSPHAQYLLDLGHPLSQQFAVIDNKGVADERAYYHSGTGLVNISRQVPLPYSAWALEGRKAREEKTPVVKRENIGFFGYYAGPEVHVLDVWALADPLLTRLPMPPQDWRIGHFRREIPAGYEATLETGENHLTDLNTATYYNKIACLTREPLLKPSRLWEIVLMNTGWYDHLVRADE